LDLLRQRLKERRMTLELSDELRMQLVREGYDPVYGARPLKRAIQRRIENPLARLIVAGSLTEGARVQAEAAPGGGEPVFSHDSDRRKTGVAG